MAVGEIMLQSNTVLTLPRPTMPWNTKGQYSSGLPKLVVDLAQGSKPRPPPVNAASCREFSLQEDTSIMRRGCTSGCSCDVLYSSSSGGSFTPCTSSHNAAAADSGFSDEEGLFSSDSSHTPSPPVLGCGTPSPCFVSKQGLAIVRPDLLSPPPILCRSSSDSSSGGCESPLPKSFHCDDDKDPEDCNSGSSSGGQSTAVHTSRLCPSHFSSDHDLQILSRTKRRLQESGFYYSSMNVNEAKKKLKGQPVGTFVLRDSSHSGFLFTLSTRTTRGTTSVRVAYSSGYFRLDCDDHLSSHMPRFDCILRLVQYYILASKRRSSKCVWIESTGRKDTPVKVCTPLRDSVSPLKHLCRRAIHNSVANDKLELLPRKDDCILKYLRDYPFYI